MKNQVIRPDPESEYYFKEGCFILEMSNDNSDELLSIARARVLPGQSTRLHYLMKTKERYVILEGQGRVEIGQGLIEEVRQGDIVKIDDGSHQRIINTGKEDLVFLALCTPKFTPECYVEVSN